MNDRIASFDGEIPQNYDHYLVPLLFDPYAADLANRVSGQPLKDVLELACGTGILTRQLLKNVGPAVRIVATDLSVDMVEYARRKLGPSERVTWRQADATRLPFPDAGFDAALCQYGWMFVPDKSVAALEVRRVLRPGGSFLFNAWESLAKNNVMRAVQAALEDRFPDAPPQFLHVAFGYHQRDIIKATLESAGFTHVEIVEVVKSIESSSVSQLATGMVRGTPLRYALQERGHINEADVIDSIATRLGKEFAGPSASATLVALVISARAG
jgi:ubiquinone/menaquinone biosynthesis C-methylase UbiE